MERTVQPTGPWTPGAPRCTSHGRGPVPQVNCQCGQSATWTNSAVIVDVWTLCSAVSDYSAVWTSRLLTSKPSSHMDAAMCGQSRGHRHLDTAMYAVSPPCVDKAAGHRHLDTAMYAVSPPCVDNAVLDTAIWTQPCMQWARHVDNRHCQPEASSHCGHAEP